jgi:hypothetical protein
MRCACLSSTKPKMTSRALVTARLSAMEIVIAEKSTAS